MTDVLRAPVGSALMCGLQRRCGNDCQWVFLALSNIDAATPARCARFLARVERAISRFIGAVS